MGALLLTVLGLFAVQGVSYKSEDEFRVAQAGKRQAADGRWWRAASRWEWFVAQR
jgi:hypothetical protein